MHWNPPGNAHIHNPALDGALPMELHHSDRIPDFCLLERFHFDSSLLTQNGLHHNFICHFTADCHTGFLDIDYEAAAHG